MVSIAGTQGVTNMNLTCKHVGMTLIGAGGLASLAYSAIQRDWGRFAALAATAGLLLVFYHRVSGLVASVCRPTHDAYSEGYESGYDKGWREGRKATRPSVVGIRIGVTDGVDRGA